MAHAAMLRGKLRIQFALDGKSSNAVLQVADLVHIGSAILGWFTDRNVRKQVRVQLATG